MMGLISTTQLSRANLIDRKAALSLPLDDFGGRQPLGETWAHEGNAGSYQHGRAGAQVFHGDRQQEIYDIGSYPADGGRESLFRFSSEQCVCRSVFVEV